MLLEVSCTVKDFMDFMDKVSEAGIPIEFDMHGADEYSSFHVEGQTPDEDIRPDIHIESSSLGNNEAIGQGSRNSYDEGDLFISNGVIYKATVHIDPETILVVDGNCVTTTLNDELKLLK